MSDETTFVVGEAIDALRRAHEAERKRLCLENDFRSYRAASQFQIEQNILLREKVYDLSARVEELETALGLLTTLVPRMEVDSSDPMGMARKIEATVRAALEAKP